MLGLPDSIRACLFDLDGVVTKTSVIHVAAWKRTFDEFLKRHAQRAGAPFVPFDENRDYADFVDGKPRADGVRDFLASRHIDLPEGSPDDGPDEHTINGIGNRKNALVQELLQRDGVEVYPGSVRYVRAVRQAGLSTAVVSSSANTAQVLEVAGIASLFDERVDGVVARELGLAGKPAPDTFLHGAELVHTPADQAAVFEDALAGVAAGRAGGFGFVVGVDRLGQADQLRKDGADIVISDLSDLLALQPKGGAPQ